MAKSPYSTPHKILAAAAAAGQSLPPPHQYAILAPDELMVMRERERERERER